LILSSPGSSGWSDVASASAASEGDVIEPAPKTGPARSSEFRLNTSGGARVDPQVVMPLPVLRVDEWDAWA
jgi:hypothetical protein